MRRYLLMATCFILALSTVSCDAIGIASTSDIASAQRFYMDIIGYNIAVDVKPGSQAIAGKKYTLGLYENSRVRGLAEITWNQPELNVKTVKPVYFRASRQEFDAYFMQDINRLFTVQVIGEPRPPSSQWNYEIKADYEMFLAQKVTERSDAYVLTNYYSLDLNKNEWTFHERDIPIGKQGYMKITVTKVR